MTTKGDIAEWFEQGVKIKAIYLFVVCDTYDWEDFPAYAGDREEANKKLHEYSGGKNMVKLMEIYDLRQDMTKQLNLKKCWAEIK